MEISAARIAIPWTPGEVQHALELRDAGLTSEQIGEIIGRSKKAVRWKTARPVAPGRFRTWAESEAEFVKQWYGKRPVRWIANELGRTRNMVIGLAGRLGLSSTIVRDPIIARLRRLERDRARHRNRRRADGIVPRQAQPRPTPQPLPEPLNVTFFDLEPNHCRWPVSGEGVAMLSCGHPKMDGSPYCPGHFWIARQPPKERTNTFVPRTWRPR